MVLAGLAVTRCGHQNQRPRSVATEGVMNERTISVSNSSPRPMVVPIWPSTWNPLNTNAHMVPAKTRPAEVTTEPDPAIARMTPVFRPAWISSLNREINNRVESEPTANSRITDNASTTQYSWMPKMYCHTSTDSPSEAPRDSATVPTMTSAAIRLRVMIIMISRMRLSAANATISRSYLAPS